MNLSLPQEKRRSGFSLVEVVLALGVVAAAVLALVGILGTTFGSAREVALQHRAINGITQLDGSLQSANGIIGLSAPINGESAFDHIYRTLLSKNVTEQTYLAISSSTRRCRRPQTRPGARPPYPSSTCSANGQFPLIDATAPGGQHDGIDTGSVLRLRVRLSPLLDGKLYLLDPTTYEPKTSVWASGQSLPAGDATGAADNHALAYLPLTVEVFQHDFTAATDPGTSTNPLQELVRPVLTQTIVLNR